MIDLDAFDRAILALVQPDAGLKSETIAAQVGLSPTAVQRRLKRLREDGVIRAEPAVLDGAKVGRPLTVLVQVTLARGGTEAIDSFTRWARTTPAVQQCWYVAGDADFHLVVTARDMGDYEEFTRHTLMDNPLILKFSSIVVLNAVKSGLAMPLD